MPVIFDGDAEYMESKAELATEILHELGLHLWDEEFEELKKRKGTTPQPKKRRGTISKGISLD